MSEENKVFETWEEVILDFLQRKAEAEEEKYLKDTIKNVAKLYQEQNYFDDSELESFFDAKKNKKEKSQSSLDFLRLKFKKMLDFDHKPSEFAITASDNAYCQRCTELTEKYDPHSWLTKAATNACRVSFATHVIKLTHSKIDSPSIYDQIDARQPGILTTSSLKEKIIDGAVAGNQFAPVFQFLELELQGEKLATVFTDETNTVLKQFTKKPDELEVWNIGFKQALATSKLSSHFLAKQIYYPVHKNDPLSSQSYHLLCQVQSSSLAHAIFLALGGNPEKMIMDQRKKNKYSERSITSYPQKGSIKVTASNHSNASQLNGKRGGRLQLFNSQPPSWQSQLKPPISSRSFFYAGFHSYRVKETVGHLRTFLLRFQRIDLSIRDPKKQKWIDHWVNQIIDEAMIYAISIQSLPAGWSRAEQIELKPAHQYFLDPYRDDEQYQQARQASAWQSIICDDFASWLNGRLKGKDKQFTPQPEHSRIWQNLMAKELREQAEAIEWDIKYHKREQQA